jgi:hypothetical protein
VERQEPQPAAERRKIALQFLHPELLERRNAENHREGGGIG